MPGRLINNSKETWRFAFDAIVPATASQEEVFQLLGSKAVASALDGINATVIAYGQTGSGKTFTISGGHQYAQRGLIPRALTDMYAQIAARGDTAYTAHITFMEIYHEDGYDLLLPGREVAALEDMPKVCMCCSIRRGVLLGGLSVGQVACCHMPWRVSHTGMWTWN
jgi:kinesin family protein 6/9